MKNIILEKKFDLELSFIRNTIINYMHKKEELSEDDINFLLDLGLNNPSKELIDTIYNNSLKTTLVKIGDLLKQPFLSQKTKNEKNSKESQENLIKLNDKLKSVKDIDEEKFNNIELYFIPKKNLFKHLSNILKMVESKFDEMIKKKHTLIKNAKEMEWKDFEKYCKKIDFEYDDKVYEIERDYDAFFKYKEPKEKKSMKDLGYNYKDIFKLIDSLSNLLKKNSLEELEKYLITEREKINVEEIEINDDTKGFLIYALEVLDIAITCFYTYYSNFCYTMSSISKDIEKCFE
jgi:hypothetical protein